MRYIIKTLFLSSLIAITACGGGGSGKDSSESISISSAAASSTSVSSTALQVALNRVTGDQQSAAPGSMVAIAPVVIVTNTSGNPQAGISVTFSASDNGSIPLTSVTTDAQGRASVGSWTLGPEKGVQTLTASLNGQSVSFSANAVNTSTNISLWVIPGEGYNIDEKFYLSADVNSLYQVATVTASVDGGAPLILSRYSDSSMKWIGEMSLPDRPRGRVNILFTATDIFGNSTDVIGTPLLDRFPVVSVISLPIEKSVVLAKTFDFSAACADDDLLVGCTYFSWRLGDYSSPEYPQVDKSLIATRLDLVPYNGQHVELTLRAHDTSNQSVSVIRSFYVEQGTQLSMLGSVAGEILDVADSRILFLDQSGLIPALKVLDTATGITQTIDEKILFGYNNYSSKRFTDYAILIPNGVLYHYIYGYLTVDVPEQRLIQWQSAVYTELNTFLGVGNRKMRMVGNRAAYALNDGVWIRDFDTNVSTLVNNFKDLAANGDVITLENGNVSRLRNGVTEVIANSGDSQYPLTDGSNVVYKKGTKIALHNGTTEIILSDVPGDMLPDGKPFAIAGGYVAYLRPDSTSKQQIWRHGPNGEEQVTFFSYSPSFEGIVSDGSIMSSVAGKRYLAKPGAPLQEISSAAGHVLVRDDKFVLIIGRSALALIP